MLGPLEVEGADGRVATGGPRQRLVLALLIARANSVVQVDDLIDDVWGAHTPGRPRKTIQVYVANLRRALGRGHGIETVSSGYRLSVQPGEVDADTFESLVAGARADATTEPDAALRSYRAAESLWRGEPFADLPGCEALAPVAVRLSELRADAVDERIGLELDLGRSAGAVPELEALVRRRPLREGTWVLLIRALYLAGRQSDALAAYQRARRLLIDQVGVEPGTELSAMERRVLVHDPDLRPTAGAPLVPRPERSLARDPGSAGAAGGVAAGPSTDRVPASAPEAPAAAAGSTDAGLDRGAVPRPHPGEPSGPGGPGTPGAPDTPGGAGGPGTPGAPGPTRNPGTPGGPSDAEGPHITVDPRAPGAAAEPPRHRQTGRDHRRVTALSCAATGIEAIAESWDPADLVDLLTRFRRAVTRVLVDHGGLVVSSAAPAIVAYFGVTVGEHRAPIDAVLAGLAVVAAVARLRVDGLPPPPTGWGAQIGIDTGAALARRRTATASAGRAPPLGAVPVLADRLRARARSGQVLVTTRTASLVRDHVRLGVGADRRFDGDAPVMGVPVLPRDGAPVRQAGT